MAHAHTSAGAANRNRLAIVFVLTLSVLALQSLSDCLAEDFDIEHSTFQLESLDRRRFEGQGHA